MNILRRRLSYLILGQKGGKNRIQIIELLKERPYNLNQLAAIMKVNYRTVKHHVDVLLKNELVSSSRTGGYGEVYFLTPEMEGNMDVFQDVIKKLTDFTTSKKFFQKVMEQTPDAVMIINEDSDVYFWNNGAERIFGYKEGEVIGKTIPIFPDIEDYGRLIEKVVHGEQIVALETKLMHKSERPIEVSLTIDGIKDEDDKIIGYSIISRDITGRKRAEGKLKISEERYSLAQRVANIGSWDWNILTGALHWSETIEPMFGFGHGEFGRTYEAFLELVHPKDRQYVIDSVNACLYEEKDYDIEHRIVWPDGTARTVSETGNVFRDEVGRPIRMLGIVQDITDRKNADERQKLNSRILAILNQSMEKQDTIRNILLAIKDHTGFEAVGIRLREGEDFPYYETKGFSVQFVEAERYLCVHDERGVLLREPSGDPVLECMCGNIIRGRTEPSFPFFTKGGSFWSNCTTELLVNTTEEDRQGRTRNRCNGEGYESVALIPLHSGSETIGLLQLNDTRKDMFTLEMIEFFEEIGTSIGIALSQKRSDEALKERESELSAIIDDLPLPIFLVDSERRVKTLNEAALEFTARSYGDLVNIRAGEAFGCLNSFDEPEGCGFGPNCGKCVVRQTILDTFETGKNHKRVEARLVTGSRENVVERDFLLSTTLLSKTGSGKVLVCIEPMDRCKKDSV